MEWENGKGANGKSCDYVKILKRNKIVKNALFKKAYHDLYCTSHHVLLLKNAVWTQKI